MSGHHGEADVEYIFERLWTTHCTKRSDLPFWPSTFPL